MDNIDIKDGLSDFLPVQDWFDEMYAKNISKKVWAVFQNKGIIIARVRQIVRHIISVKRLFTP